MSLLPPPRLIGREAQLGALRGALDAGERLITLHGPPGVGKTALARSLLMAERRQGSRCAAARLTGLARAESVRAAIALAVGGAPAGPDATDALGRALAAVSDLLVLDDAEAATEVLRALVPRWLELAPTLQILVASQRTLGLSGERRVPVRPLDEAAARTLFAERRERLGVEPLEDGATAALLAHLDGLPLALELAAARSVVLGPDALLQALRARVGGGSLALLHRPGWEPSRHDSLAAAVGEALDGLWARDARFLGALALADGAVDEGLAHALDASAADRLQRLWERSLVERVGEGRVRLLGAVAAAALARLEPAARRAAEARLAAELGRRLARAMPEGRPSGEPEVVAALRRDRHLLHAIGGFAGAAPEDRLRARLAAAAIEAFAVPAEDRLRTLEGTSAWVLEAPALGGARALALGRALLSAARASEAREVLEQAVATAPRSLAPLLWLAQGSAAFVAGDGEAAENGFARADGTAEAAPPEVRAAVRGEVAYMRYNAGAPLEPTREALDAALAELERGGDVVAQLRLETLRGIVALDAGELADAEERFRRARARADALRALGDRRLAELGAALTAQERGELAEAEARHAAARRAAEARGTPRSAALCAGYAATLHLERGEDARAAEALGAASVALVELGDLRYGSLFGLLTRFARGALPFPDPAAAQRDPAEAQTWTLLASLCRARARGEPLDAPPRAFRATMEGPAIGWDLRFALRLGERGGAPPRAQDLPVLRVDRVARIARLEGSPPVDLRRRAVLWRVLEALADAHLAGVPRVDKHALYAAGWPKEPHTEPRSAAQRVHTTVRRLRQAGLGDSLASDREGYWLEVRRVELG